MAERTCATCRHWRLERADGQYGECLAIESVADRPINTPPPLATMRDAGSYEAILFTRADFGCAMHEEK